MIDEHSCLLFFTKQDSVPSAAWDLYVDLLSHNERLRLEEIKLENQRREFLLGKALARTTIAALAGIKPQDLILEEGQLGKPAVAGPASATQLEFSTAHAHGINVCLIAQRRRVGVDVEWIGNSALNKERIAAWFFSEIERNDVMSRQGVDRAERFFSYWTLKEAYVKERGTGFAIPFHGFWFDIDGEPTISFENKCSDPIHHWFGREALTSTHRVAWSIQGLKPHDQPSVVIRETVPLATAKTNVRVGAVGLMFLEQNRHPPKS